MVCCECSPLTNPEPIDFRPADLGFRQTPSGLATGSPFGTAKQTLQAFAYSNGFQQWVSHWSLSWFQRNFRGKHRFFERDIQGFRAIGSFNSPNTSCFRYNSIDAIQVYDRASWLSWSTGQWPQTKNTTYAPTNPMVPASPPHRHKTVLTPQKTGVTWIFCVFTGPGWRILPSWSYILSWLYIYIYVYGYESKLDTPKIEWWMMVN